jgi:hypothetical protein
MILADDPWKPDAVSGTDTSSVIYASLGVDQSAHITRATLVSVQGAVTKLANGQRPGPAQPITINMQYHAEKKPKKRKTLRH